MRAKSSLSPDKKMYDRLILEIRDRYGVERLGLHANKMWNEDPKHLLFALARYKFVSKMLSGRKNVLEVGCGDAFGSRLVVQEVGKLVATDIQAVFIDDAKKRAHKIWRHELRVHNMLKGRLEGAFDAAYALDVLEHIDPKDEDRFVRNILASLTPQGILIIGMPSMEAQVHSKPASITGHINCKSAPDLKEFMEVYFENVFLFSMNDEVVHTGHPKMAHYLFALCCGIRAG